MLKKVFLVVCAMAVFGLSAMNNYGVAHEGRDVGCKANTEDCEGLSGCPFGQDCEPGVVFCDCVP